MQIRCKLKDIPYHESLCPGIEEKFSVGDKISCILPMVSNLKHDYKNLVTFVTVWLKFSRDADLRISGYASNRTQIFGKLPNIRLQQINANLWCTLKRLTPAWAFQCASSVCIYLFWNQKCFILLISCLIRLI